MTVLYLSKRKPRFPRKAKKWAKKNGVTLIMVKHGKMWYASRIGYFKLPVNIYDRV